MDARCPVPDVDDQYRSIQTAVVTGHGCRPRRRCGRRLFGRAERVVGTAHGLGAGAIVVLVRFGPAVLPAYLHYLLTAVVVGAAFLALGVCISATTTESARALGGALLDRRA